MAVPSTSGGVTIIESCDTGLSGKKPSTPLSGSAVGSDSYGTGYNTGVSGGEGRINTTATASTGYIGGTYALSSAVDLSVANRYTFIHIRTSGLSTVALSTSNGVGLFLTSDSTGANEAVFNLFPEDSFSHNVGIVNANRSDDAFIYHGSFDPSNVTHVGVAGGILGSYDNIYVDEIGYIDPIKLINGEVGNKGTFLDIANTIINEPTLLNDNPTDNIHLTKYSWGVGDGSTETHFEDSLKTIEFPETFNASSGIGYAHINNNDLGFECNTSGSSVISFELFTWLSNTPFYWNSIGTITTGSVNYTSCTIKNAGQLQIDAGHTFTGCLFDGCGEIVCAGDFTAGNTIKNSTATNAVTVSTQAAFEALHNCTFNNNNTAIRVDVAGDLTVSAIGMKFSGNTYDIEYTGTGTLTIQADSATNITTTNTPNGGTVSVQAPDKGIVFNNLVAGSQLRVYEAGTQNVLTGGEWLSTGTSETYVSPTTDTVDFTIYRAGYRPVRETNYYIGDNQLTYPASQQIDRAYQENVTFIYGTDGDYTANTFNVSKIMTVQQYYSAMIDAWIAQATLKNTRFPITPNGGNSFSFDDCSINESQFEAKLYRDGVRVTSGGTVTDMWAAIWTNLPSSDTAEIQQISGASFTDIPQVGIRKGWNAPSGTQPGTVDMLLKIYGGSGTLDYTNYLVIEYAVAGKYQGRVVAHDTYSPLQDELYVLPVAPTDSPIPATDPALVNPPTIEFAPNGTPVSWKGYNWYITIKDSAVGNSGADIANWFNYHIREQNDSLFEGKDPFNYWDCIRDNGAKWKTIRGILWGDYGDTEVGVRVVDTNYEPHPDFNSMIANDGAEYEPPVLATRAVTNLPNDGTQRLQIYNNTTGLEVYNSDPNSTTYSETYENGTGISANDSIRITFTEINGGISFKSFRTVVTASADGFSVDASNFISSDSVYATNGVDGTTVTKFTADFTNDEIDVSASADFSAAEAYAFYCATLNTEVGIYDFWGGITAIDTGNYRINSTIVNMYIDETFGSSKKQTDEARIFRSDGLYPVKDPTTSGYGVQVNWKNVVYTIETGVSGVTAQDKVDIAEEIMNYTV